jgi:hypothetical protein
MARHIVERIRSGGQTGVDRAALDAAIEAGIPHTGWCPRGRRSEDGPIPSRYHLIETAEADYAVRTGLNVRDADGTLILTRGAPEGGTRLTLELARAMRKPVFLADPSEMHSVRDVRTWLRDNGIRELNVAGPRASKSPSIRTEAHRYMERLLANASRI